MKLWEPSRSRKFHPLLAGASWRLCVPLSREGLKRTDAKRDEPFVTYDELGAGLGSLSQSAKAPKRRLRFIQTRNRSTPITRPFSTSLKSTECQFPSATAMVVINKKRDEVSRNCESRKKDAEAVDQQAARNQRLERLDP